MLLAVADYSPMEAALRMVWEVAWDLLMAD
jgi:hypothetical protein